MDYHTLRDTLTTYYHFVSKENVTPENVRGTDYKGPELLQRLDDHFHGHEQDDAYQLKAYQYQTIADGFEPIIFPQLPFYFEMGTKSAFSDGCPSAGRGLHPGGWTFMHNMDILTDHNSADFQLYTRRVKAMLYCICGPRIETMHFGFPYEAVLRNGLSGIYAQAKDALARATTDEERHFAESAMAGLEALRRVAKKFSEKATRMLDTATDERERHNLRAIASAAASVPWEKPTNFYEGLNTIAFLREATGALEGIGISALGRPDKYLYPLYRKSVADGMTETEASDLICKFLLIWDCRLDRDRPFVGGAEHELECTINLGGCDNDGRPIANELTRLFLDAYASLNCIYPKFQCRYSADSPQWYLERIATDICNGRANYLLANDDALIPALVHSGKTQADARKYLVSGCWDIFCDGLEHRPGGEYLNLIRPMEWALCGADRPDGGGFTCDEYGLAARSLDGSESFNTVYQTILYNIDQLVRAKVHDNNRGLELYTKAVPLPLYSACMGEPLVRLRDIHNGGVRYAPGSIYYVGFANLANALMAIRTVCFEKKGATLRTVMEALHRNWANDAALRTELMHAPYYCDGTPESEAFCRKLHEDLCDIAAKYKTVHGDPFDPAYLVYVEFKRWGAKSGATPDGRYAGDLFSHGIGPDRNRSISSFTKVVNGAASLGLTRVVNSIENLVLPAGGIRPDQMVHVIRAIGRSGLQSVHLNCVSREELLDAQIHPEGKEHLIVRVCGFSVKFTSMSKAWQDEFLSRNFLR